MMASNDGSPARSRSSRTRAWVSVLRRHSGPSRRVPWGRNVGERHGAWGERCAQGVNTRAESVNRLRLAYVALRSPLRLHAVRPVGTARRMPGSVHGHPAAVIAATAAARCAVQIAWSPAHP
jgi:hypothetical protein